MLEMSGNADLRQEALDSHDRCQLGLENLEGNQTIVLEIAREKDRRHAAGTDLPLDDIASREWTRELFPQLRHGAKLTSSQRDGQRDALASDPE